MEQTPLFCESLSDALDVVIKTCGGAKVVGCQLWPEKTPEAAQKLLLACLNEHRSERLNPDQLMFLLKLGRQKNCHAAMHYLSESCGYTLPQPLEPEDEQAQLKRDFIQAFAEFKHLVSKMDRAGLKVAA